MDYTTEQTDIFKAVEDTGDNIAIVARAGTGKTTTLVGIAERLEHKEHILAVSFSKDTTEELGNRMPSNTEAVTLNALGNRALSSLIKKRTQVERFKLGNLIKDYCNMDPALRAHWAELRDLIKFARYDGIVPTGCSIPNTPLTLDTDQAWLDTINRKNMELPTTKHHLNMYRQILRDCNDETAKGTIDFDDMLYAAACFHVKLIQPSILMVDEAQDLSSLQHEMVRKMMGEHTRLIICGDPMQAIYAFRGASSNSMDQMSELFDCVTKPLTISFRCSKSVIKEAQSIVPDIKAWESNDEGKVVPAQEWSLNDIHPGDAILCRHTAPLVSMIYSLVGYGTPATVLGRDIGKDLKKLLKQLCKNKIKISCDDMLDKLNQWELKQKKIAFSKGDPAIQESAIDKAESIRIVYSHSWDANTVEDLFDDIDKVFSVGHEKKVELSTIHKVKGMEWDNVFILDSHLIGSKKYKNKKKSSTNAALPVGDSYEDQEKNLKYVAVTRARRTLTYINTNQEISLGDDGDVANG